MTDFIQLIIVAAIVLFAVYKLFPEDHPLKKLAVVIFGGLAVGWDMAWPIIQGLLQNVGIG